MADKNQAVIDFLVQCPQIRDNPLFFNFLQAKDNSKQFVTTSNDKTLQRPYIDGTVLKRYTFTLIDYRSITYEAVVMLEGYANENMEEFLDVQSIMDWIDKQADNKNYPNFGDKCIIDDMRTLSDTPNLNSVDTSMTPALARYSISVQIDYLDISGKIWN